MTFTARFVGGPLDGETRELPDAQMHYHVHEYISRTHRRTRRYLLHGQAIADSTATPPLRYDFDSEWIGP